MSKLATNKFPSNVERSGMRSRERSRKDLSNKSKVDGESSGSEGGRKVVAMPPKLLSMKDKYGISSSEELADTSSSGSVSKGTPKKEKEILTEVPNYREIVERQNAVAVFDIYVQIVEIMITMEPLLFKEAVRTLRTEMKFKFDIEKMTYFKKLYPELVPSVFTRLWNTNLEPKEKQRR